MTRVLVPLCLSVLIVGCEPSADERATAQAHADSLARQDSLETALRAEMDELRSWADSAQTVVERGQRETDSLQTVIGELNQNIEATRERIEANEAALGN